MRGVPAKLYVLSGFSAILQILSFPVAGQLPYWRGCLAWIALVPLLLALLSFQRSGAPLSLRQSIQLGYLCGVIFFCGNCYWIYQTMSLYGGLPKPAALLILLLFSAYLGLYCALFGCITALVRRSSLGVAGALAAAPFSWVAVELARARVTGFPWDLLGYSQIDNHVLLLLAPAAGVMALSFVLAAVNAGLTFSLLARETQTRLIAGALSLALALGCSVAGGVVLRQRSTGSASAVLLQENLSVGAAARGEQPRSLQDELASFARLSAAQSPAAGTARPTIVLWPEAPSHLLANDPVFRDTLGALARQVDAPLVIGSIGVDQSASAERGYSLYDSATVFDRTGHYQGRYDKIHLVPWGEYVPYKQFFAFAHKLTEGVGDMDRGTTRSVFQAGGHAYGIFICYESIFGDEVRQFVRNGAQVLVNLSDDGWYGDTGAPWQHLNMARMRTIENRRWLLRDTNTGETTVIDPHGNYTETARHVRTAYVLPFGFESGLTLYTRFGDWFAYLCAAVTVVFVSYGLRRRHALK